MKLNELTEKMREYNRAAAPGSECTEWGDYWADCYDRLGVSPSDDTAETITVPADMADYWIEIIKKIN